MDVGKIDGVNEPSLNRPKQQEDQRRRRTEEVREADKVNISSTARKAAKVAELVAKVKELPEVRPDKVAEAVKRLEAQKSDDEEVNRTIAHRLLDDLL